MSAVEFLLAGTLAAALPLLLAALGEMVVEKTGLLNLGLEGMMALGAAIGFITVYHAESHSLGFLTATLASSLLAMLFAFLVIVLRANEVAAGLAIGVLGLGLSSLFGKTYESFTIKGLDGLGLPLFSDIPVLGPTLFTQDIVVWLAIIGTAALWYVLNKTKLGLIVAAVGENAEAARAIGYPVAAIRTAAVAFGGGMCGLAGGLCFDRLHTALGRRDDRRARLDRTGFGGVWHLANRSCRLWRPFVRRPVPGRTDSPGRRCCHPVSGLVEPALCRDNSHACRDLAPSPPGWRTLGL